MSFTASASGANPEPAPTVVAEDAPGPPPAALEASALAEALSAPVDAWAAATSLDAPAALLEPAAQAAPELDDLAVFVGANATSFLQPLTAGHAKGRGGICWPGLLLPTPWFLYRKMYGLASFTVLLPVLLSLLHVPGGPLRWLSLGYVVLGGFGKSLYLAKARRAIATIREAASDEAAARAAIAKAGGVSIAGAVFGLLLIVAFFAFAVLRT